MTKNLEHLKRSRASHRRVVTKYFNESNTIIQNGGTLDETGVARLEQLEINIHKKQDQLSNSNSKIQELITDEQPLDDEIQEAENLDDKYGQFAHQIQQFFQRLKTPTGVSTSTDRPIDVNFILPKLNLLIFSGGYMERQLFFDLFKGAMIDNTRLTKSQKLQHLKSSLTGDADKLLHSITITDDNFDIAIDILENRYDNKRLILRSHLHEIFRQRF